MNGSIFRNVALCDAVALLKRTVVACQHRHGDENGADETLADDPVVSSRYSRGYGPVLPEVH